MSELREEFSLPELREALTPREPTEGFTAEALEKPGYALGPLKEASLPRSWRTAGQAPRAHEAFRSEAV